MGTMTLTVVRRWKAGVHELSDQDPSPAWTIWTYYSQDDAMDPKPSHAEANGQAATMFRIGSEMDMAVEGKGEAWVGD